MYIAIICTDKADHLAVRQENRAAHLAYIEKTGVVEQAGPFLDEDEKMCGSLLVLNVETMAQAKEWAQNDPYAQAGLFTDVRFEIWKKVIG